MPGRITNGRGNALIPGGSNWLAWAREIEALAEAGYTFASNPYERERSIRLRQIAAEIIAQYSQLDEVDVLEAFAAQPGYVTPKVDVRGAVFRDEKLLMVREAMDGRWTLPGGWADVGETPSRAVEREVLEEAGLMVRARKVVGVYDANRYEGKLPLFHAYKLVFLCTYESGEPGVNFETTEAAFFAADDLPERLSSFRTTPKHLEDVLAAHLDPAAETVFD
jgi:ADP-ribose pyrophosphatase YjhB (NUDIX family)